MTPLRSASGMNTSGTIRPRVRVVPAHQRLHADDRAAWRARPSAGTRTTISPRRSPRAARRAARAGRRSWRSSRRVVDRRSPARGLGVVHRDVGELEQPVAVGAVLGGRQGDADARVDGDAAPRRPGTAPAAPAQPLGHRARRAAVGVGEQHGELVAAEPGHSRRRAATEPQPGADLLEQDVAVAVAEGVVDLLEAVEVEQQQRRRGAAARRPRSRRCSRRRFGRPVSSSCVAACARSRPRLLRRRPAGLGAADAAR